MNYFKMQLPALDCNEKFARSALAAFCVEAAPTLEEIGDVKTAVSEAVTNVVVHAYDSNNPGEIFLEAYLDANEIKIVIKDKGVGIPDVDKALEPFYSTKSDDERSGMGFTVMQTFMDKVSVVSKEGEGTTVELVKIFGDKQ